MRAHADRDDPLRVALHALLVRLRVAQLGHAHRALLGDLVGGAMAHEHRLAAPLERLRVALANFGQVDLDRGERQLVARHALVIDERARHALADVQADDGRRAVVHVGEGAALVAVARQYRKQFLIKAGIGNSATMLEQRCRLC